MTLLGRRGDLPTSLLVALFSPSAACRPRWPRVGVWALALLTCTSRLQVALWTLEDLGDWFALSAFPRLLCQASPRPLPSPRRALGRGGRGERVSCPRPLDVGPCQATFRPSGSGCPLRPCVTWVCRPQHGGGQLSTARWGSEALVTFEGLAPECSHRPGWTSAQHCLGCPLPITGPGLETHPGPQQSAGGLAEKQWMADLSVSKDRRTCCS